MSAIDPPDEHSEHTDALSRLVLSGWGGSRIGDPVWPDALVYVRDRGVFVDALLVSGPLDAVAARRNAFGAVIRRERGTVAEVVAEVLLW